MLSWLFSISVEAKVSAGLRNTLVAVCLAGISGCATQSTEEIPELDEKSRLETKTRVADSARLAGDYTTAIRLFKGLIAEYPDEFGLKVSLANTFVDAKSYDDALPVYKAALKSTSGEESIPALNGAGRAFLSLNQPDQALRYFNQALTILPMDVVARNGKAVVLDQLGRHSEAQDVYRSLVDEGEGNPAIRNNLALSLILTGDYEEAITLLSNLSRSPYSTEKVRQNLALALGLSGDIESARKVAGVDLDFKAVENNIRYYELLRGHSSTQSEKRSAPKSQKPEAASGNSDRD